jgi:ribosomal RNA-processing protein 9
MPDAFFATSKPRKRKRAKNAAPGGSFNNKTRKTHESSARANGIGKRSKAADEELDSDRTNDEDGEIDDMDLRASGGEEGSGDEVEDETPAEKRLRLAKMYLESVKGDLGAYGMTFFKRRGG